MAKRRRFTPKFKAKVVIEALSSATCQAEVCRRHNLNENQLSQWKRQLLENAPIMTNLILTLRNCGLNKRMHFTLAYYPYCY